LNKANIDDRVTFYALQQCKRVLVTRKLSICTSVRPSVRLSVSVKRVICDKTKKTCTHILIPHERSFIPTPIFNRYSLEEPS